MEQIAYWESLPPNFLSRVEFILVDDCSEESPAIPATRLDLTVFRVTTRIAWNQPGARNLAAFNSRGKWGLFFDLDQRFHLEPMETLLQHLERLDNMTLYHFLSENDTHRTSEAVINPCHPNTFLVNLEQFKIHVMYDEDFAGHYGYDDIYMTTHWEHEGGKRLSLNDFTYFKSLSFWTEGLDRDTSYNKLLGDNKILAGTKNSVGILRFEWEKLQLVDKPSEASTF